MASLEDRVARVHCALHARVLRRIHLTTTPTTRQLVDTACFVILLHAVALLALLHVSFVNEQSRTSCFLPFLPAAARDEHVVRVQVVAHEPSDAAIAAPLASYVFASQPELLALRQHIMPSLLPRAHTATGEPALIAVPRASGCFDLRWLGQSSPLWAWLLDAALGYDTIVANHVARWRGHGGVLLNEASGCTIDLGPGAFTPLRETGTVVLVPAWLSFAVVKVQTLYLCVSLFFTSVTLVGFLVNELFARSIFFSDLMQRRAGYEDQTQYTHALGVHCAYSLAIFPIVLGMVFFFLELYKQDYVLAFGVLAIVAVGETFAIICARSALSRRFFPRLFFCWFALFHVYLGAFPNGFTHLALLVVAVAVLHTMLFFVNCVELPEFLVQRRRQSM